MNSKYAITFFTLVSTLLLSSFEGTHLQNYPKDYFRSPLDIPLELSGNFGEIRTNHFHSGLDFRTQQVEGKNVYAVADGFVSRIKVSAWGFGYALYITHPNHYVSVYGHLMSYNSRIAEYVKQQHYKKESFEMDIFPDAAELPVSKGEIIGLSGNTGGSAGPHLHFELRDQRTEFTLNPLFFGYNIPDSKAPVISGLYVYPMNDEQREKTKIAISGSGGNYSLMSAEPMLIQGRTGIGIEAYDTENNSSNKNGVYALSLKLDDEQVYFSEFEKFSFSETKYVNAHIDYEEKLRSGKVIQRLFLLPNNKMSICRKSVNHGIIELKDNTVHKAEITLSDLFGNTATLKFNITSDPSAKPARTERKEGAGRNPNFFAGNKANSFHKEDIRLEIPEGALYDDILFRFASSDTNASKCVSPLYRIHDRYTPLHSPAKLSIKASAAGEKNSKLLIVSVDAKGNRNAVESSWANGFVSGSIKVFGDYAVALDTVKPVIRPHNFPAGNNFAARSSMSFKISDNLSGIKSYRAEVDGKWILLVHEGRSGTFTHFFDEKIPKGKHELSVAATDAKGNSALYKISFNR